MVRNLVLAGAAVVLLGCNPTQQAALQAPAVYQTVVDPNVPLTDKACTVLGWGIPLAQERAAESTLSIKQQSLVNGAIHAASAYCGGRNLAWQERAVAAADVLSKVLWDIIR